RPLMSSLFPYTTLFRSSPSGSTYSDQPSTYILVQGNADLKNGWVKPRIWTTQITKLAKKGDIIITVRAPAGKVGRTNFDVVLGRDRKSTRLNSSHVSIS